MNNYTYQTAPTLSIRIFRQDPFPAVPQIRGMFVLSRAGR
jgi:hypothetical protein